MTDTPESIIGLSDCGRSPSGAAHGRVRQGCLTPRVNLFRRNDERDIMCAVSEDRPVPAFLHDPAWTFAGRLDEDTTAFPGFDIRAARSACSGLGFYLFQTWGNVESGSGTEVHDRN